MPPELALLTPVEVSVERILFTGAYSRKHLKAFFKLISCFPGSGLLCPEGLGLAQGWPGVPGKWLGLPLPEHTPVVEWMKGMA